MSRSSAVASWQLQPWTNPPLRTGISRECGSVTLRRGCLPVSSPLAAACASASAAACARRSASRAAAELRPGAGRAAGLPGPDRGLPRRHEPVHPQLLRGQGDRGRGSAIRGAGLQRLQVRLPLLAGRGFRRLPLAFQSSRQASTRPARDRGSGRAGTVSPPSSRSAPGSTGFSASSSAAAVRASAMTCAASFRSPASVRLASFDALAAIFTPSPATTPSRPSPAPAHTCSTWQNRSSASPSCANRCLRNRENVVWSGISRPHATRNVAS